MHIFGNRPSPSIANFGLIYATTLPSAMPFPEAPRFIREHIYVDDGLGSAGTPEDAIKIISDARSILNSVGVRMHKITSNSSDVLSAFPREELANQSGSSEVGDSTVHGALGVSWNTAADQFVLSFNLPNRPFSRRGLLATTNAIYDPLGIASPITLAGRIVQRSRLTGRD